MEGFPSSPSPLDLTTVADVKTYLSITASTDDGLIQGLITSWGYDFLLRTGLGDQSGDFAQSPFTAVCNFDEFYDGTGTYRLFLHNRPIVNVTAVLIDGISLAPSPGFAVQGYVIDGTRKSISVRPGLLGWGNQLWNSWQAGAYHAFGRLGFARGIQNVEVQYSAGYSTVPFDIQRCAYTVVGQNYKRRSWIDEQSRSMAGGGGTIRYRDWDIPPDCQRIVDRYTRTL